MHEARSPMHDTRYTINDTRFTVNRQPMRSLQEIKKLFTEQALADKRIRAVLLQGSRANKNIMPDPYQDFDIFLIVDGIKSFLADHLWTNLYGEKIAWQLPDEMGLAGVEKSNKIPFHYLMLFTDGTRIDLSLFPKEKMNTGFKSDSLTEVWVDKDALFYN